VISLVISLVSVWGISLLFLELWEQMDYVFDVLLGNEMLACCAYFL